jgi:hypothetical protein
VEGRHVYSESAAESLRGGGEPAVRDRFLGHGLANDILIGVAA